MSTCPKNDPSYGWTCTNRPCRRCKPWPTNSDCTHWPWRAQRPNDSGNRLNIITKKVTSWAAIIAVPTAITGFYGQNLPYPGFARDSGFITSTVLIVLLSVAVFITFKRKDWL